MARHDRSPREPTWSQVSEAMKSCGWSTMRFDNRIIVFERGKQKIVVRRMEGNNWEVDYYSGKVMDDTSGIDDSRFAKMETIKMGLFK